MHIESSILYICLHDRDIWKFHIRRWHFMIGAFNINLDLTLFLFFGGHNFSLLTSIFSLLIINLIKVVYLKYTHRLHKSRN